MSKIVRVWARLVGSLVASWLLSASAHAGGMQADVNCTPAPCVLPNVLVSSNDQSVGARLSVNPLNTNAMVITGARIPESDKCGAALITHVSVDRGSTWRTTCMPEGSGAYMPDSNIASAYDHTGRLHLITRRGETFLHSSSTDNGLSLDSTVDAVPAFLGLVSWGTLAVDTNASSAYRGSVYVASTQRRYVDTWVEQGQIWVSRSRDGGVTWDHHPVSDLYAAFPGTQRSAMTVGRTGTLYLAYTLNSSSEGGTVYVRQSRDGGVTWTWPVAAMSYNSNVFFFGAPSIAADNSTGAYSGTVYLAMTTRLKTGEGFGVVASADGVTWGKAFYPGFKSVGNRDWPQVRVSARGEVGISWLDSRNNPDLLRYDIYAIFSRDRFATLSPETRLSTAPGWAYTNGGLSYAGVGADWGGNTLFVVSDAPRNSGPSYDETWLVGATRAK